MKHSGTADNMFCDNVVSLNLDYSYVQISRESGTNEMQVCVCAPSHLFCDCVQEVGVE